MLSIPELLKGKMKGQGQASGAGYAIAAILIFLFLIFKIVLSIIVAWGSLHIISKWKNSPRSYQKISVALAVVLLSAVVIFWLAVLFQDFVRAGIDEMGVQNPDACNLQTGFSVSILGSDFNPRDYTENCHYKSAVSNKNASTCGRITWQGGKDNCIIDVVEKGGMCNSAGFVCFAAMARVQNNVKYCEDLPPEGDMRNVGDLNVLTMRVCILDALRMNDATTSCETLTKGSDADFCAGAKKAIKDLCKSYVPNSDSFVGIVLGEPGKYVLEKPYSLCMPALCDKRFDTYDKSTPNLKRLKAINCIAAYNNDYSYCSYATAGNCTAYYENFIQPQYAPQVNIDAALRDCEIRQNISISGCIQYVDKMAGKNSTLKIPKICYKIWDRDEADQCYLDMATETSNPYYCQQIVSQQLKDKCLPGTASTSSATQSGANADAKSNTATGNDASAGGAINTPGESDLTVANMTIASGGEPIKTAGSSIVPYYVLPIIKNIGTQPVALDSNMKISIAQDGGGINAFGPCKPTEFVLNPGEQIECESPAPLGGDEGHHTMTVTVDYNNVISESSEGNNNFTIGFTLTDEANSPRIVIN